MSKFSLRGDKPKPQAAAGLKQVGVPTPGESPAKPSFRLPYAPGGVLRTAREKNDMKLVGLGPSDPVPQDLASRVQAAREGLRVKEEEELAKVIASGHQLTFPKESKLEDLPDNKRDEILRAIEENSVDIDWEARSRVEQQKIADLPPHLRGPLLASMSSQAASGLEDEARPQPPPSIDAAYAGDVGQQAEATKPEAASGSPAPTLHDKMLFLAAIAGGPPFRKEYALFANRFVVSFRHILRRHEDLATKQARLETRDDPGLFPFVYGEFRLLLSLDFVATATDRTNVAKEIDTAVEDILRNNTAAQLRSQSLLLPILDELRRDDLLQSESVWLAITETWNAFTDLVSGMEKQKQNASFWRGIDG